MTATMIRPFVHFVWVSLIVENSTDQRLAAVAVPDSSAAEKPGAENWKSPRTVSGTSTGTGGMKKPNLVFLPGLILKLPSGFVRAERGCSPILSTDARKMGAPVSALTT